MQKTIMLLWVAPALISCTAVPLAARGFATLYRFTGENGDGAYPTGSLVMGRNAHLFGTTQSGGAGPCPGNQQAGCGSVFELAPPVAPATDWTETVLYSFGAQESDGAAPYAGVIFGPDEALFGTTVDGGTGNLGTVFMLAPPDGSSTSWTEKVLHSFTWADGAHPYAGLLFGENGVLYGTTLQGGSHNCGTVFGLVPPTSSGAPWSYHVLHDFSGQNGDGCQPYGSLVIGHDRALYGTASYPLGIAFSLQPTGDAGPWSEEVIYTFGSQFGGDGGSPEAGLTFGPDGGLYGTNYDLGALYPQSLCVPPVVGCGTVFKLQPAGSRATWAETTIHQFTGINGDGANPKAGVIVGRNGVLFGATTNPGTLYRMSQSSSGDWTEEVLHTFTGQNGEGFDPNATPLLGSNDVLYGTTVSGGTATGKGTVWAFRVE